ncbi:class 1 isoprenoid biosynthesis enzyme [Actinokineospora fastidiosa]|uniref:Uncharacterized protein n=1 Tax=Actinokineospora fastidiosa TaxID=1816 RepID=A0A918GRN6_9PSEU|nr:class 1 isoprenoid biosynthesis enzyme [Actinokineospora fastidiosa]GGS56483.1 hypothetical protein GCM10010171_59340 [Actinokineospora fastidiosa]
MGVLQDVIALVRHARWAGAVPGVRRRAARFVAVFDRVALPVLTRGGADDGVADEVADVLRATAVKLAFLASAYADMARVALREDLAVLAGAVTRVYDDLVDHFGGPGVDERLALRFAGGGFTPANAMEAVFAGLYDEIIARLDRPPDDPVFGALARAHAFQVRSREQTSPHIDSATVERITDGKGGYGMVVLFDVAAGPVPPQAVGLIHELGGALQLLDDYQDVDADRAEGVTTSATRGAAGLAEVCARLRDLAPRLRACFGDHSPLYAVVYAALWMSFVRRRFPRRARASRNPLGILLRRVLPLTAAAPGGRAGVRGGTGTPDRPGAARRRGGRRGGTP